MAGMPEQGGLNGAGLDDLLASTRRALETVRGVRPAGGEPMIGTGTAADEQVRVTAAAPGEIVAFDVDPRLLRLPSHGLSVPLMAAVNAALADRRAKAVDAAVPGDVDRLGDQLADLHNESVRQMERFTTAIAGAVAQIRARGQ